PDSARHVGDVRAPLLFASLDDHHVADARLPHVSSLRPACLSMAFIVPGGTSSRGLSATVTTPGLLGCLYCRWLPRVRARRHPSSAGGVESVLRPSRACRYSSQFRLTLRLSWRLLDAAVIRLGI